MSQLLLRRANVFAPTPLGEVDILIVNQHIVAIGRDLSVSLPDLQTIDVAGRVVIPGVIDQHIHVTGGGGEGGPVTRCPELVLSELVGAGITTVVGVSGTDSVTRSIPNLLGKVRALNAEGVTAYMWTSNYQMPVCTVTDSVRMDLFAIPEVIGVKLALGDHRSSFPTQQDVMHLLSDIRVGGMIAGKPGFLHVHLGDLGNVAFDILDACCEGGMPIKHIRPTHCARHQTTWDRSVAFALRGGVIDVTAGHSIFEHSSDAVLAAMEAGVDSQRITMSTDAHGSMPRFDENGVMVGLDVAPVNGVWEDFQRLVEACGFERAVGFVSTNLATNLELKGKGEIKVGADADMLVLNDACEITHMMAKGRLMMRDGEIIVKGTFEH